MNIFTFFLSLTFLTLVLADEPVTEQAFQIPMWAIIVVAVIIAVLLLVLGYFIIRRYSAKKQTVDTFNELEKHPSTKSDTTTAETIGSFNKTTHSVYKPAMIDQEKLSLPLPPPSTSLFSDKMELNSDDAMKLFEQYTQTDRTKGNGLQQKMGTIRSTLKQSLRRTKSKSRKPDVNHMFDTTATATPKRTSTDLPRTSLSTMSQHTSTTLQASLPGLPLLQDPNSTKTFKSTSIAHHDQDITTTNDNDSQPNFSTDSLPISVSSPLTPSPSPPIPSTPSPALPSYINNNISNNNSSPSPSPPPPPSEKEITDSDPDPIHAARRAIRSASRKSKTRSTLLNEDDVLNLFKQEEEWAAKFGKQNNKDNEDDSEDGDTARFKNKDRQRASISYGYTTISGKSANHTRYITDEMLEKRANTIGRSYQVTSPSQQQQQQKSSNLETLFTSPLPKKNQPLSPGNEKLEMAHPFETLPVPTTKNTNDIDSDKVGSSKYAIPDELLYQQNNDSSSSSITHGYLQKRPSLATEITSTPNNTNNNNNGFLDSPYISSSPSSTINNNNRHRNSIVSNGRKTIQDRMDNFEGRSDQTGSTGHSRKSSGSAATMIRISQQHSQTWSGRSPYMRGAIPQHQRNPNTTSSSPYDEDDENDGFRERTTPIPTPTLRNHKQQQQQNGDDDDDESLHTKQPMFYTMRSTKPKQRNGLPSWYSPPDDDIPTPSTRHKTPAERERDEYLNTLYGNPRQ